MDRSCVPVMSRNDNHFPTRQYRSVWISDIHLGFKGCRADDLLAFLRSTQCERLYLLGDIIDLWSMRKGLYWPQAHNNVVRTILGKAKRDTDVIYIPGNHDEALRAYHGLTLGKVKIRGNCVHETADGRRLLMLHGDDFDSVVTCSPLLALIGSKAYAWLLTLNRLVNWGRRRLGWPYWSLAAFLKHKVKNAVNYISNFEEALAQEARRQGANGVVCGHIHRAELRSMGDITYMNCGDWVESCTALVEHFDGRIELIDWIEQGAATAAPTVANGDRDRLAA